MQYGSWSSSDGTREPGTGYDVTVPRPAGLLFGRRYPGVDALRTALKEAVAVPSDEGMLTPGREQFDLGPQTTSTGRRGPAVSESWQST